MKTANIIALILWSIAGTVVLARPYKVTKFEYALCWVVLIFYLIDKVVC